MRNEWGSVMYVSSVCKRLLLVVETLNAASVPKILNYLSKNSLKIL